jgi:regulator of replication initiation timing
MSMITNKTQLLENALASYQAAANELIAELKRQRNDLLEENAMLRADIAKLDNFLANQDE